MIMILFFAYLLVPYEDDDGEEDNEAEFSRSRFVALLFVFWLAADEVDACLFSTVGVVIDDDVVVLFAAVDTIDIYLSIVPIFFIVEYLYLQF